MANHPKLTTVSFLTARTTMNFHIDARRVPIELIEAIESAWFQQKKLNLCRAYLGRFKFSLPARTIMNFRQT
jgi:hypothetical protein